MLLMGSLSQDDGKNQCRSKVLDFLNISAILTPIFVVFLGRTRDKSG